MLPPPGPIKIKKVIKAPEDLNDIEMPLVDHLEELRQRILRSLFCILLATFASLIFVKPLVTLLEAPARSIHFLQLAPGEFLFVSLKVAFYAGLTISMPFVFYQGLAFILPGLTNKEKKLIGPAVAASAILFITGLIFAWSSLVPAALGFLVNYGADVVEPLWSIEKYLDFVLMLMIATGLAFQLPVLQLLLGVMGLVRWKKMLSSWRWVVISAAIAGAVLTPSTDPITMLLLSGAITTLFFVGVGLVALSEQFREQTL